MRHFCSLLYKCPSVTSIETSAKTVILRSRSIGPYQSNFSVDKSGKTRPKSCLTGLTGLWYAEVVSLPTWTELQRTAVNHTSAAHAKPLAVSCLGGSRN